MTRFCVSVLKTMAPTPSKNTMKVVVSIEFAASVSDCCRFKKTARTLTPAQADGPSLQDGGVYTKVSISVSLHGHSSLSGVHAGTCCQQHSPAPEAPWQRPSLSSGRPPSGTENA